MQEYNYNGYRVRPFSEPVTQDNITYNYYVEIGPAKTKVKFTSLADARRWCKQNYLTGIYNSWI